MKPKLRIISAAGILVCISAMFLLSGCVRPAKSAMTGAFEVVKASYADGFYWRSWEDGDVKRTCLEIVSPGDSVIVATVYRDSISWMSDARRGMTAVVIGPIERGVATLSTTHVALISSWDSACIHWSGGAYVDFIRWQPALDKLARGDAHDIGGEPEVDREKLVSLAPAVLTIYPFGDPLQGVNLRQRVPVVPIMEYLESQPLGRAEWMRAMGWMMGDSAAKQSDLKFLEIAGTYERLRNAVAQKAGKPRVFTGSVQQGTWHAPGSTSFIATLLEDAGLTYILDSDSGRENVEVALEKMVVLSQTADAWGMVTHHPGQLSRSAFLEADERHAMLLPPTQQVFMANTANCDYFGMWVARPDAMLENLVALFDEDYTWSHDFQPCFEWIPE